MLPPPPGRLVDVGTHRLHLHTQGAGSPAVVFDAALGASSLSWSLVQPRVAEVTRACTYDRAGFGWSDRGPLPRTAGRIAGELGELLHRGEVPPPYVLVGHSFGGLVMRLFASRHPADVAGLVLIEPAIPEEWSDPGPDERALAARGARLCRYGEAAARLRVAWVVATLAELGALELARSIVSVVSRGVLRREDEGILAPVERLPWEVRRLLRHMWIQPKFFEALGSQIDAICESATEVIRAAPAGYAELPVVVISSATAGERRLRTDAALARSSARGRHVLAEGSGHWIPLDAPQVVVDSVVRLVREVRQGR